MIQTRISQLRIPNPKLTRGEAQDIINECLDEIVKLQKRRDKPKFTLREVLIEAERMKWPSGLAEQCHDDYEKVGWIYGKSRHPIVSLPAAMRTWRRNHEKWNPTPSAKSPAGWADFITKNFPTYKDVPHSRVPEFVRIQFAECRRAT